MGTDLRRGTAAAMFLVVAVAWGFNYPFVRVGIGLAAPLWLAFLRAAVGAAGVSWMLASVRGGPPLGRTDRWLALGLGIPNTSVFFGLWFLASASVPPGEAAVFVYTYPLWVSLLSVPLLRHRPGPAELGAVLMGFAGVALMSEPWVSSASALPPTAIVELLVGAIAWALGTVLTQRFFAAPQMQRANAYQLIGGSIGLLGLAVVIEPAQLPAFSPTLLIVVLWIGLVGTALGYGLWYALLGRIPAATLSAFAFLVPVVALGASVAFLGETLDAVQVAGVALVAAAIFLVGRARRRSPRPSSIDAEREAGPSRDAKR